jgi:hypothetical protein
MRTHIEFAAFKAAGSILRGRGSWTAALAGEGIVETIETSNGASVNDTQVAVLTNSTRDLREALRGGSSAAGTYDVAGGKAYIIPSLALRVTPLHLIVNDWETSNATGTAEWFAALPALRRCALVLDARRRALAPHQIEALRRQLRALLSDEDELKETGVSVSIPSLDGLIRFLATNPVRAHPSISVTRNGYFSASWSPRRRAKLTLTFSGSDGGEWVGVDLDDLSQARGSGTFASVPPYGIPQQFMGWMAA